MKRLHSALTVAACLGAGMLTVHTQQRAGGPTPRQWWVAKATPGQYGTNKPHIKLRDLKARHKGQSTWMEVVVNDENYHAEYNQGAPGTKISTVMHPDTREFYAVMEGQMRFTLEGLLRAWLLERPGAESGDCPDRPVDVSTRLA